MKRIPIRVALVAFGALLIVSSSATAGSPSLAGVADSLYAATGKVIGPPGSTANIGDTITNAATTAVSAVQCFLRRVVLGLPCGPLAQASQKGYFGDKKMPVDAN